MFRIIIKQIDFQRIRKAATLLGSTFLPLLLILFHLVLKNFVTKSADHLSLTYQISFVTYVLGVVLYVWFASQEIRPRYLYKLAGMYGLYLLASYGITITQNINNGSFKLQNLLKNDFFQLNFVPTMILTLGLAAILGRKGFKTKQKKYKHRKMQPIVNTQWTLYGFVAGLFLTDVHSYEVIVRVCTPYLSNSTFDFTFHVLAYLICLGFLYLLLAYVVMRGLSDLVHNRPSVSLAFTSSLFFALIFNYTIQYDVKMDSDLFGDFILPGAIAYQIIIFTVIGFLCYLLVNRYVVVSIFLIILGSGLSVANSLKDTARNEPLLITDFVWLKNVRLLLTFVNASMIIYSILTLALLVGIYLYIRRFFKGPILKNIQLRSGIIASILVFFGGIYIVFKSEEDKKIAPSIPVLSILNNDTDINYQGFKSNASYKSLMFVWTKQLTKNIMDKPSNYSQETMDKLLKKYTNVAKSINETRTEDISNQTIIYVLSESFADPTRLDGVHVSQDVIPNIRQIMSETTSGTMRSDGYGGGTANMEFQTLTGLPYTNFSASVSTIYTEIVPKMSVFPALSDQFEAKNRIIIHPSEASNYSREYIYNKLGFSTFIATSGGDKKLTNPVDQGLNVSDKTVYENLLENINVSESQFFSVITMQNHMPWSEINPSEVTAEGDGFSETENDDLTSYARLLTYTDTETKELLSQLSQLDKKITLVFYGDHLPGLYPNNFFKANPSSQYETDYFIWSNDNSSKMSYDLVSSSDFIAALFAHTNSKVSPYYALLTEYLNKANISKEKLSKEQKEIANDLKLVQYDITAGQGYLKQHSTFFKIAK